MWTHGLYCCYWQNKDSMRDVFEHKGQRSCSTGRQLRSPPTGPPHPPSPAPLCYAETPGGRTCTVNYYMWGQTQDWENLCMSPTVVHATLSSVTGHMHHFFERLWWCPFDIRRHVPSPSDTFENGNVVSILNQRLINQLSKLSCKNSIETTPMGGKPTPRCCPITQLTK